MSPIDDILYPAIEPYHSNFLQVSALHQLYFEPYGQPQGIPVLFVHGSPGGGCEPMHRRFFEPQAYIVLFDRRGAGRSPPMAELTDNTTPHLIADIERLEQHLGIERWLVFGDSWSSILGLAFQRQKVLLYFYPKDNTLGCTREACAFRDQWRAFQKLNVAILGVSIDDEQSHQSFAKKYALPFTLHADPEEVLVQAYGAWGEKSLYGKNIWALTLSGQGPGQKYSLGTLMAQRHDIRQRTPSSSSSAWESHHAPFLQHKTVQAHSCADFRPAVRRHGGGVLSHRRPRCG